MAGQVILLTLYGCGTGLVRPYETFETGATPAACDCLAWAPRSQHQRRRGWDCAPIFE